MEKIKIGIVGYGNLGKGVEKAISINEDMELFGIFTRRDPKSLNTNSPCYDLNKITNYKTDIDVLILCGGSKSDIPEQGPLLSQDFNTVDAYDNHQMVEKYFTKMNDSSLKNNKTSIISTGWDPGLFSLSRVYSEAILPVGKSYTFWGKGVSQGHSDALRRIEGIKLACQYTIPKEDMIEDIYLGKEVDYNGKTAHKRECYIVLDDKADQEKIIDEIKNMPDYFLGYETEVFCISEDEFLENHREIPHGGKVIRRGKTSENTSSIYDFSLDLGSNPEFTASVNVAFARACHRLNKKGHFGAMTVLDVPPALLSIRSRQELLKSYI